MNNHSNKLTTALICGVVALFIFWLVAHQEIRRLERRLETAIQLIDDGSRAYERVNKNFTKVIDTLKVLHETDKTNLRLYDQQVAITGQLGRDLLELRLRCDTDAQLSGDRYQNLRFHLQKVFVGEPLPFIGPPPPPVP